MSYTDDVVKRVMREYTKQVENVCAKYFVFCPVLERHANGSTLIRLSDGRSFRVWSEFQDGPSGGRLFIQTKQET